MLVLATGLVLKGEEAQVNSIAYATAKAGIWGYSTEIVRVEADLKSTKNDSDSKGTLKVYILGENVDWSFPIEVPVRPFNVKEAFGIRGSVGLELESNLDFLLCSAKAKPSIDTKAFAEIGLDYKVASAEVGGELTILKTVFLGIQDYLNIQIKS